VVKVIDFGVAKAIGQQLTDKTVYTQFAQLIGTPLYMSPEQAGESGLDIDTRSDIYSLGVLLYELLTGTTPFDKERLKDASYEEIRRIIREEEPPKPSTRISTLGQAASTLSARRKSDPRRLSQLFRGELDWIVMKALEKDRNRRYETASAFLADVQRYLHDEPVQACPPSAGYRLRKFVRRNRSPLAVAGFILLFMAVLGGGSAWVLYDRAVREDGVVRERLAREAALDKQLDQVLEEAERLRGEGKWPEALAAVERGDKLLASAGRADRPAQLLELHEELNLAQRLENIYQGAQREPTARAADRSERDAGPRSFAEGEFFWGREQDTRFAKEFRDFGIDIDALAPAEAAARISRTGIRAALVQALDEWTAMRKRTRGDKDTGWKKLLEVARQADGDDWRNRFREALAKRDRQSLERLADSLPIREAPPATVYLLGHTLMDLGSVDRAATVLREGQRRHPEDFWLNEALGYLSKAFLRPPRYDDALRYYTAALAVRPRSAPAHQGVAAVLFEKGATDDALAQCSRAIELNPDDAENWYIRGRNYLLLGQFEKAVADLNKAIEVEPRLAQAWNVRGFAYLGHREYDKAIADLSKAVELDPNEFAYRHNRGRAYYDMRQMQKAIADLTKAIEVNAQYAPSWNIRSVAYFHLHEYDKALTDMNRAIELEPKHVLVWLNRGHLYMNRHQFENARSDFSRVVELDPKNSLGRKFRAAAYLDLRQWDQAMADIAKWLEANPGDHWPWLLSAALHLRRGDTAGYRLACREMLNRFGSTDRPEIAERVAKTCSLMPEGVGNFEAVVKLANLAVKRDSSQRWFLLVKGLVEYRAGRHPEAVAWLKRCAPKTDGEALDASAFAVLTLAEVSLGRAQEARTALASARAILAQKMPDPDKGRYFSIDWHDWLHAQILCREAERLLDMGAKGQSLQSTKDAEKRP
jgi:tetratricopeptide (TPR) repeat protein